MFHFFFSRKYVDSDADMMLTEAEYCLAAHLADKYSSTGFSFLSSSQLQNQHLVSPSDLNYGRNPSLQSHQHGQRLKGGKDREDQLEQEQLYHNCDIGYLDNAEDDSHDLLLSPDFRPFGKSISLSCLG